MELLFDRGTILVGSGGPPQTGAGLLPPYFRWDSRVSRWRSPAFRWPEFRASLRRKGIAFSYRPQRPSGFAPERIPVESLPGLRTYQLEALEAWIGHQRRGIVCLPTGSGKTRLATHAVLSSGTSALVLVPTCQLLHQWKTAIREFYSGAVGVYGDGQRDLQPITVATYESGHGNMDRLGDHFDLLVVDEAHHITSVELVEALEMATAPFRLGLSATFFERKGLRLALEASGFSRDPPLFEKVLGPVCFDLPVARLSGKYLADFEIEIVPLPLTADERRVYDRIRTRFLAHFRPFMVANPKASWLEYLSIASESPEGREAVAALNHSREILSLTHGKLSALDHLLELHREDSKLVFTRDNRSAYEVSRRFLVPAITCDIDRKEREEILERFRRGIYGTIVSARVLNEGIDVPAASVAIVLGCSSDPAEYAQRLGRVLRPLEGKRAIVYELVVPGTSDWKIMRRRSCARSM